MRDLNPSFFGLSIFFLSCINLYKLQICEAINGHEIAQKPVGLLGVDIPFLFLVVLMLESHQVNQSGSINLVGCLKELHICGDAGPYGL